MTGARDLVAGVDVGGSAVKAWVAGADGVIAARRRALPVTRTGADRVTFDPTQWWREIAAALAAAVAAAGAPPGRYAGVTAASLRQGFVLLGGEPRRELGAGVLNSDRRGAAALPRLRHLPGLYAVTGHWPAPELTLAKLIVLAGEEPERWQATRRVLFVHDWVLWRLAGVEVTELSYACAGQLAAVAAGDWARDLLAQVPELSAGGRDRLAPLVRAGDIVGAVRPGGVAGLPAGLPVVAGCGDTQLAAAAAGGLAPGVITVVAGSSTPVITGTGAPPTDPAEHPWISSHVTPGLFAVETNAGYPGTFQAWWAGLTGVATPAPPPGAPPSPGVVTRPPAAVTVVTGAPEWSERAWSTPAPAAVLGFGPATTATELADGFADAHAFAVCGNVTDLERVLGHPARQVRVTGGGAAALAPLLAEALGRPVTLVESAAAAAPAGVELVTGATPCPPVTQLRQPTGARGWAAAYQRYRDAWESLHATVGGGTRR